MNTIELPISPEKITGFNRIGKHENFVITPNLNMIQQIRAITLDAKTGQPITELISVDVSLSPEKKQVALNRYADQIFTRQTEGAFVNSKGQVVEEGAEGAIPQLEYFQAITLGDLKKIGLSISDKTPVLSLIYAMIGNQVKTIDERGDL